MNRTRNDLDPAPHPAADETGDGNRREASSRLRPGSPLETEVEALDALDELGERMDPVKPSAGEGEGAEDPGPGGDHGTQ